MAGGDGGQWCATIRLIDSGFLKYRSWFPADFSARADVTVAPLLESVKRVALVADRAMPLRLAFSEGEAVLEAGAGEYAQAVETIEVDYKGDPLRPAFRSEYLMDGLSGVETERPRLHLTEPTKPAVLTDLPEREGQEPTFRYLVQPLRVT